MTDLLDAAKRLVNASALSVNKAVPFQDRLQGTMDAYALRRDYAEEIALDYIKVRGRLDERQRDVDRLEAENMELRRELYKAREKIEAMKPKHPVYDKSRAYTHSGPAPDMWFSDNPTCPSCGVVGEHECDPRDIEQNRAIAAAVEGMDGDE